MVEIESSFGMRWNDWNNREGKGLGPDVMIFLPLTSDALAMHVEVMQELRLPCVWAFFSFTGNNGIIIGNIILI